MDQLRPHPELYDVPWQSADFNGMPYRRLGGSGLQASAVGLGAWKFGHPDTKDGARVDEPTAHRILDRAIELGVTLWDTANRYNAASGNSERVIGTWLAANPDQRRNVVLATKMRGGMDGVTPNHSGLSRSNIRDSVSASLARLQTDHIDLLYFHRPDDDVPVEESLEAIDDLVRQGIVRYFAVSNFDVAHLDAYAAVQGRLSSRCRPVAVQNQYDSLAGEPDEFAGVLGYCARHPLSFIAWSPLAGGLLTDRYLGGAGKAGDRLVDEGRADGELTEGRLARVRRLAELAGQWDLQVSQLALAYLLSLPGMGPVIPSSSTVQQLESNAAAGRVTLTDDQLGQIRSNL